MDLEEIKKQDKAYEERYQELNNGIEVMSLAGAVASWSQKVVPDLIAEVEQQKHRADQLFKQVPALKKYIEELEANQQKLRTALENLLGEQNGPPLLRHEKTWRKANDEAIKLLYRDK